MEQDLKPIQCLLSLPSQMAAQFEALEGRARPEWFAASDPPGRKLGSGGGTAHLLTAACQGTGSGQTFSAWLNHSRKLVILGGGSSRRLPAYAPLGKVLMPVPVLRWAWGQRLNQTLLDVQAPEYQRVLDHAPAGVVAMVTSGDVLLEFGRTLPPFPDVDVLGLGMWAPVETAQHFGVFFAPRHQPSTLAFFLQKPAPSKIREFTATHFALVDTGMWLLSERAVRVLLARCGWDAARGEPGPEGLSRYELYAQFGLGLGETPAAADPEINALTSAVVPLPEAQFHHFGTNGQLIESLSRLQTRELNGARLGLLGAKRRPDQHVLNSRFDYPLRLHENHTLWVENSIVPASWHLASHHVLTGVPENAWDLRLEPHVCLDFAPVAGKDFCLRVYGFADSFQGRLGDAATQWLGRPALGWFEARGLTLAQAGLTPDTDIQQAPLFPVLAPEQITPRFIEWLFAAQPPAMPAFASLWLGGPRLSAEEISQQVNLPRLYEERAARRNACIEPMRRNFRWSVFHRLDLESTARLFAAAGQPLEEIDFGDESGSLTQVHDEMFRAAVLRHCRAPRWVTHEDRSFSLLRGLIVREAQLAPARPEPRILEDQIVWARSPARLDLAGGWTDTPPYCLEHGGRVLNLGVDLNGQPPIQVFARLCPRPELVVRSIDLGVEQRIHTYAELEPYAQPGSEFALAKAALALAGFLPQFHADGGCASLEEQLRRFGGGLELSMLCAVPKGSGLGTSSILAATLLAALGDLCGLHWDRLALFRRTLAMEQMLTTGGGWQDQAGAIFRGVKLIETPPGLAQVPTLRWLPEHLFEKDYANRTVLLYYTGLTRMAKGILQEIVRGIFLNSPTHLRLIEDIGANALQAADAIQAGHYGQLTTCVRRSWTLNQRLDAGTNPPEVQVILHPVADLLAAAKLLGAGGGGYLLMFAKDETAAARVRHVLAENPPNPRARFVDLALSQTGLQVTRS
jgi:galactokinase/mevalonate kinase-like predicted kinase